MDNHLRSSKILRSSKMDNRYYAGVVTTSTPCKVAGFPAVIWFDYEYQPREPAACLDEGYLISSVQVTLTEDILKAIAADECVDLELDGRVIPVTTRLEHLRIIRGEWEIESEAVERLLAEWQWEHDASERYQTMAEARADALRERE